MDAGAPYDSAALPDLIDAAGAGPDSICQCSASDLDGARVQRRTEDLPHHAICVAAMEKAATLPRIMHMGASRPSAPDLERAPMLSRHGALRSLGTGMEAGPPTVVGHGVPVSRFIPPAGGIPEQEITPESGVA